MKNHKNRLSGPSLAHLSNDELKALVEKFPFYAQAYAEMARRAGNDESVMRKAALYATSREQLRDAFLSPPQIESAEKTTPLQETAVLSTSIEMENTAPETNEMAETPALEITETTLEIVTPTVVEEEITISEIRTEMVAETTQHDPSGEQQQVVENETETADTTAPETPITPEFLHTSHTFDEWLSAFGKNKVPVTEPKTIKSADEELNRLIETNIPSEFFAETLKTERNYTKGLDRFIEVQKTKASQQKQPASGPNFVTETLAKIYEKQGLTEKAIDAYEQLSLKFPEKKAFFALRIQNLKEK